MTKYLTGVMFFLSSIYISQAFANEPIIKNAENASRATVGLAMSEVGPTPFCSGVLLSRELVLTAAHCAQAALNSNFSWVLFGKEVTFSKNVSKILDVYIHPGYTPSGLNPIGGFKVILGTTNDLAILRIEPAPTSFGAFPAHFSQNDLQSKPLIGFGWGIKAHEQQAFGFFNAIYKSHLLPTSKSFDANFTGDAKACHGDSGGPIFMKTGSSLELAGVISYSGFRFSNCSTKSGVTAINLNLYKNWINCASRSLMGDIKEHCE